MRPARLIAATAAIAKYMLSLPPKPGRKGPS
jgi:hypothetical protein